MSRLHSFRLEMLQVARLAPKTLGEATSLVETFLRSHLTSAGGFGDREGRPDLYYTVFGLEGLLALQAPLPKEQVSSYLTSFHQPEKLDFVHLCSLVRCLANVGWPAGPLRKEEIASSIEAYRSSDGGYHGVKGRQHSSAYGSLLAWGAYSDMDLEMPGAEKLPEVLRSLRLEDGSFANEPGMVRGTTTATAAAVALARYLNVGLGPETAAWILSQAHPAGGFLAAPGTPLPDLLSTATALHALDSLQVPYRDELKENCLDFLDSLWSAEGGFHGHWADDFLDAEYTYYGLLALGHLGG